MNEQIEEQFQQAIDCVEFTRGHLRQLIDRSSATAGIIVLRLIGAAAELEREIRELAIAHAHDEEMLRQRWNAHSIATEQGR